MADELVSKVFEVEGWGWIGLVASERGLRGLFLPRSAEAEALAGLRKYYPNAIATPDHPLLTEAQRQVTAYLSGELREFNVPVDLRGNTSFALSVWSATTRIGYGETRAYRWIADQIGGGGAGIYQAVGAALGANPVPLIIPCHRVVGSDGSLHGYAGGLDMKLRLLSLESGQGTLAF
ncbi:MAG: methylated-DNA--[protein]-cysteine S-methyltransferase [Nitrososphaerales archaeon]